MLYDTYRSQSVEKEKHEGYIWISFRDCQQQQIIAL